MRRLAGDGFGGEQLAALGQRLLFPRGPCYPMESCAGTHERVRLVCLPSSRDLLLSRQARGAWTCGMTRADPSPAHWPCQPTGQIARLSALRQSCRSWYADFPPGVGDRLVNLGAARIQRGGRACGQRRKLREGAEASHLRQRSKPDQPSPLPGIPAKLGRRQVKGAIGNARSLCGPHRCQTSCSHSRPCGLVGDLCPSGGYCTHVPAVSSIAAQRVCLARYPSPAPAGSARPPRSANPPARRFAQMLLLDQRAKDIGDRFVEGSGLVLVHQASRKLGDAVGQLMTHDIH